MCNFKKCPGCGEELELSEENFYKQRSKRSGFQGVCKKCQTHRSEEWRKRNPQAHARNSDNSRYKSSYGITKDTKLDMIRRQEGLCLICQEPMIKPCVDHNHITGEVRGILCNPCNTALGSFRDSILHLERAIRYLRGEEL